MSLMSSKARFPGLTKAGEKAFQNTYNCRWIPSVGERCFVLGSARLVELGITPHFPAGSEVTITRLMGLGKAKAKDDRGKEGSVEIIFLRRIEKERTHVRPMH